MNIYKAIPLILALSFVSLSFTNTNAEEYPEIARNLIHKTGRKFESKYKMKIAGTGLGIPEGTLKQLKIAFYINDPLTIRQAREILIECADDLLKKVEKEKQIKICMETAPFTYKNIEVGIFICNENWDKIFLPNISIASLYGDRLSYRGWENEESVASTTVLEETIEEALEILKNHPKDPHP